MIGNIFDVKHFAVHDGPGIRTTVFFKGCPLKCKWCHNPESISPRKQLGYIEHKCVNCGKCIAVCPTGAHAVVDDGIHCFDRNRCIQCGKCAQVCPSKALSLYGRTIEMDSLISELVQDVDFYESSNGGVTLSGGECLAQADFCAKLLIELKKKGIHTAVDTCGFVSKETIDKIIDYTDLFLYDIKSFDEDIHQECTGVSNKTIIDNLKYIDSKNKKIEIRYPYVPGYNSEQVGKIAVFLKEFKNIVEVKILPYHNYASTKYKSLDMENTLPETIPTPEEMESVKKLFRDSGFNVRD